MNITVSPFSGQFVSINIEPELASEEAQIERLITKLDAQGVREFSVYLVGQFPQQRRAIKMFISATPPTPVG